MSRIEHPSGVPHARGVVLIIGLALCACQTQPLYRPQESEGGVGYHDEQLAKNRYRITFSGGVSTHRDQVEDICCAAPPK